MFKRFNDPDYVLGRDFTFRQSDGNTVQLRAVSVIAWDPKLGVRLWGPTFEAAWVPADEFIQALELEILS